MGKKVWVGLLFFILSATAIWAEETPSEQWARQFIDRLTLRQKVGQLFFIESYPGGNEQHFIV
ncbi:MAG: hypothetical protein OEY34_09905, partial [Cyclobacteriaceae bacterium]|nr:hypothetical protein [Cyclobacteriaceae bacterium]